MKPIITEEDLTKLVAVAYERGFRDALKLASETFNGIVDDLKQSSSEAIPEGDNGIS